MGLRGLPLTKEGWKKDFIEELDYYIKEMKKDERFKFPAIIFSDIRKMAIKLYDAKIGGYLPDDLPILIILACEKRDIKINKRKFYSKMKADPDFLEEKEKKVRSVF